MGKGRRKRRWRRNDRMEDHEVVGEEEKRKWRRGDIGGGEVIACVGVIGEKGQKRRKSDRM